MPLKKHWRENCWNIFKQYRIWHILRNHGFFLNLYAFLKKKYVIANHTRFGADELQRATMQRTRLRKIYLKRLTEATKVVYKCVNILKKSKIFHFKSLDVKFVKNNKFSETNLALFSNKIKSKEKITFVENDEIISRDIEVAKTFLNFVSSIVKNLNLQRRNTSF